MRWMMAIPLALAGFVPAAEAAPFRAENRVTVTSAELGFDVRGDAGFGARGMWCAAADYARRALGVAGTERIYIAEARTPGLGQRGPVRFTLDAGTLPRSEVFIVGSSLSTLGANLSVDHAYSFCADAKVINR